MAKRWRAFYSLDRDERDPISDAAAALTVAANTLVINTEALADGLDEAQVSFVIAAEDEPGELVKEAEMVFGQLREHAGLDPVGGRLLAFIAVRESAWERALQKASGRSYDGLGRPGSPLALRVPRGG